MKKNSAPPPSPTTLTPAASLTDDPLLTGREVCKILRFAPRTLYRKRIAREIVGIPVSDKRYLYRTSVIRRYLQQAESGAFSSR